jgi:hypothetical protein
VQANKRLALFFNTNSLRFKPGPRTRTGRLTPSSYPILSYPTVPVARSRALTKWKDIITLNLMVERKILYLKQRTIRRSKCREQACQKVVTTTPRSDFRLVTTSRWIDYQVYKDDMLRLFVLSLGEIRGLSLRTLWDLLWNLDTRFFDIFLCNKGEHCSRGLQYCCMACKESPRKSTNVVEW